MKFESKPKLPLLKEGKFSDQSAADSPLFGRGARGDFHVVKLIAYILLLLASLVPVLYLHLSSGNVPELELGARSNCD